MRAGEPLRVPILYYDQAVHPGGSIVVLARLLDRLDRSTFKPLVVTSLDEESIRRFFRAEDVFFRLKPGLSYTDRERWMARVAVQAPIVRRIWAHAFSFAQFLGNLPQQARLAFDMWRERPMLVHVNNGKEGFLAARVLDLPVVEHLHGLSSGMTDVARGLRPRTDAYVSVSEHITAEAEAMGIPAGKIATVPNPAPTIRRDATSRAQWRTRCEVRDEGVLIAHVGRLVPWKGQREFLAAFARISSACPSARVLVVGDDAEGISGGYSAGLRDLVRKAGLEDRVLFTGHIADVMGLMSAVDLLVHSSIRPEPFGLVITEAMAAGAAVLAARLGAPMEIVTEGVTGRLVDPLDEREFSDVLRELISDGDKRRALARAGQDRVNAKYSPDAYARRIEDVYRSLLSRRPGT